MEDVGIFYGYLLYFMAIWYISGSFGVLFGVLAQFCRFGMLYQEKSGNPVAHDALRLTVCHGSISRLPSVAQKMRNKKVNVAALRIHM
jgi:hypothetical protein